MSADLHRSDWQKILIYVNGIKMTRLVNDGFGEMCYGAYRYRHFSAETGENHAQRIADIPL
jgi:hypothetical protein